MKRLEMVRTLMSKAAQDEAVLEALLPDRKFNDETLGFHAQQAVEKTIKAWLAYLEIDYPKVHSIEALIDILAAHGKTLPDDLGDMGQLTPFATVFRYDTLPISSNIDRASMLKLVRDLRTFVETQIGDMTS
jgi:HEPN domain-containing protein